jgi:hypothetical protein
MMMTTMEDLTGGKCRFLLQFGSWNLTFFLLSGNLARDQRLMLTSGICLPASCSPAKVVKFTNVFLQRADLQANSAVCRIDKPYRIEIIDIVAM